MPSPPPHPAIISPSYIKHTGFTKNVLVQTLNKYVFPDSLDKTCIMTPTEDERFSQHITTVKPLKFPSLFRPHGSLPFVALHIFFFYHGMLKIYQIQALIVRQFVSISVIKTTVTPIASMSAVKFPLNILLTIKTIST